MSASTCIPPYASAGEAVASPATRQRKPRSKAARTVVSMHMWVIMPTTIRSVTPIARRRSSSSVPRNELGKCLVSTASPGSGATSGWISAPSVPGRKKVEPGRMLSWRIWMIGMDAARQRASTSAARRPALSASGKAMRPPGK